MRVFLAVVVAVTQFAGSWLCCCGSERLVALVRPSGQHLKPLPAVAKAPGCCQRCQDDQPTQLPVRPDGPAPGERLPCCGFQFVAVPADKPVYAATADALLVPVSAELSVAVPVEVVPVVWVGLRELPHLTTADRLYAHHVLRC